MPVGPALELLDQCCIKFCVFEIFNSRQCFEPCHSVFLDYSVNMPLTL